MFTILWLIRSFQGVDGKGGENFWQFEWFLASIVTVMVIMLDFMLIKIFI
jgi:hypothetical protein